MASTTVIDTLIVKLGLDPKDFTKGTKQAAADEVKLEQQVKKSSANMSRDFTNFAGKVMGLAGAAVMVKKFIGYTSELSTTVRQLGIDAANYKIAASELRNFGNIAEMNGGKAEDATKTISGLAKAVYDLAYNGSMSDSLIMLGRLGVQFQDTTGNMRDFKSIVLDTQGAIQNAMKGGTSHANAYQMLLQAGFDPGLAQAMLKGNVGEQLARQSQRRQISAGDVAAATAWEESAANRSQALDAAGVRAMAAGAPAGTAANNLAARAADAAGNLTLPTAADAVSKAFDSATSAIGNFVHGLDRLADDMHAKAMPRGRAAYDATIAAASKKYNLPADMLAGILQTESNFNPAAKSGAGAVGIAQLMPQYFPGAGKNPHADIYTAAEYVRKLHDAHVAKGDADDAGAWTLALQSYNAGQTRVRRSMQPGGKPLAQETMDYPGKVLGYAAQAAPVAPAGAASTANRTDITFENVTIQTNAKDGNGFAQDFVEGTKRKLNAAQADTGMQ